MGILGIGGLGHLALKFGIHHGCETVALSRDESKRKYCQEIGVHKYVNLEEKAQSKTLVGYLDAILVTAGGVINWTELLSYLAPKGTLIILGLAKNPIDVPATALILGQKTVCGSAARSSQIVSRMLNFCALHKITPDVETFGFENINAALAHTASGKAKFRTVLVRA